MKILVIVLLILILFSLFSGLFFMYRDKGQSKRTVQALTIRVVLSIALFIVVIISLFFGLFPRK